jgi:hypothetical protein
MGGMVLALFLGACDNPSDGTSAAQKTAEEYRIVWDHVLGKNVERAVLSDEADVDEALEEWEALDGGAQAELAAEKTKLDSLKAKIHTFKSSIAAWRTWLEGKPDNTASTPYPVTYTGRETPAAIYKALATAGKYVNLDLSASSVTGFVHDLEPGRALVVHLVLPDSLEEIEDGIVEISVFSGFTNLKSVSAAALRHVGTSAFYGCASLETVTLDAAVDIGGYAFQGCSLTAINLPNAESLGDRAFLLCSSLATINLPKVTTLGNRAFGGCSSLTTVTLPEAVTLGPMVFTECNSITTVNLPKAVTLDSSVFYWCRSLATINLPEAVTLGNSQFNNCASLATISLPKAASIGNRAFSGCTSLNTVILGGTPPTIGTDLFYGAVGSEPKTITIKVPDTGVYTAAGSPWTDKIGLNSSVGNYWDNSMLSPNNLTVALAAIDG